MYQEQILKIFREFEKEESHNSWLDVFADKDSPTYKLQKQANDFLRPQRFIQFLHRRKDLLDILERSIVEDNKKQIEQDIKQTAEKELQKLADKMIQYYFKLDK